MSPADYFKSVAPSALLLVGANLLCMFVLAVAGVGRDVIVLTGFIALVGVLVAASLDYARRRRFYRDLNALVASSEHPRWLTGMIERPAFSEGELTYDALCAIAKSANDDVAEYRLRLNRTSAAMHETFLAHQQLPRFIPVRVVLMIDLYRAAVGFAFIAHSA